MIQKTPAEKQALKDAKAKYRQSAQEDKKEREQDHSEGMTKVLSKGILDTERILPDDYPVNWYYLYVVDDDGGKVICSEVSGTILQLKQNLRSLGYRAENIYSCDINQRVVI